MSRVMKVTAEVMVTLSCPVKIRYRHGYHYTIVIGSWRLVCQF